MPFDLPAEHVQPLLESRDPTWAMNAQAAWDWLTASGEAPVVSLRDLEYFLWYQLPAKFMTSAAKHREVALALGDLLGELGYEAGAALCRGPVTMSVLGEWEKGSSSGYRALRRALEDSGVEPPDTEALEWSSYMGLTESAVFDATSVALERAIAEGEFTPGTRGWKRAQAAAARRFLTTPVHSLDERTPQAAVWEERQEYWAERPGRPVRQQFLRGIRERIRKPPPVPEGVADRMRPLIRLLEVAGGSPRLTQAGYLPPAVVRELVRDFDWWHWTSPPRSEADAPPVLILRAFAKEAGLVRMARGRLHVTDTGRRAISDQPALWTQVVRALASGETFTAAIRELLLAQLLSGTVERDAIATQISPALAEAGWRPVDGRRLTEDLVSSRLWDAIRPMDMLGILRAGAWPDRGLTLTDFGIVAARAILWHRSTSPRKSVA